MESRAGGAAIVNVASVQGLASQRGVAVAALEVLLVERPEHGRDHRRRLAQVGDLPQEPREAVVAVPRRRRQRRDRLPGGGALEHALAAGEATRRTLWLRRLLSTSVAERTGLTISG